MCPWFWRTGWLRKLNFHLYLSNCIFFDFFVSGVTFQAHKLILAACSKHFHDLFESAPLCPNIVVILDGTSSSNMAALLEFMYKGEVHVAQERLSTFLKAAEYLQVTNIQALLLFLILICFLLQQLRQLILANENIYTCLQFFLYWREIFISVTFAFVCILIMQYYRMITSGFMWK